MSSNGIVTLTFSDGSTIELYNFGTVKHIGNTYCVMQPTTLPSGMSTGDVWVFKTTPCSDGTTDYEFIDDKTIFDAVVAKWVGSNTTPSYSNSSYTPDSTGGVVGGRAIGNPINMLLDLGVFIVLMILITVCTSLPGSEFVTDVLPLFFLAAGAANAVYFLIHLVGFIFGKR